MDYEKNERMGPLTPMAETRGSGRAREFGQILGQMAPQTMPATERIALHNVDEAFTYQPWDGQQQDAGAQVREALVAAAKTILRTVPDTPLRSQALADLFAARMKSNAAISFRGRF